MFLFLSFSTVSEELSCNVFSQGSKQLIYWDNVFISMNINRDEIIFLVQKVGLVPGILAVLLHSSLYSLLTPVSLLFDLPLHLRLHFGAFTIAVTSFSECLGAVFPKPRYIYFSLTLWMKFRYLDFFGPFVVCK